MNRREFLLGAIGLGAGTSKDEQQDKRITNAEEMLSSLGYTQEQIIKIMSKHADAINYILSTMHHGPRDYTVPPGDENAGIT